jgi:ApaG protein
MVQKVTKGIKISVKTSFEGTYFQNYRLHFAFHYHITIENKCKDSIQVVARKWEIFDALNRMEIIEGEGIVGKKPVILPGETHTYESGSLLTSPIGAMRGFFEVVNFTTTNKFKVSIPTFQLNTPYIMN